MAAVTDSFQRSKPSPPTLRTRRVTVRRETKWKFAAVSGDVESIHIDVLSATHTVEIPPAPWRRSSLIRPAHIAEPAAVEASEGAIAGMFPELRELEPEDIDRAIEDARKRG